MSVHVRLGISEPRGVGIEKLVVEHRLECYEKALWSRSRTEPLEQIKKEIAALKADKSVPEAEKKDDLAQLEALLKNTKPIQFKENIALVLKYFDQLAPFMQAQDTNLRPGN